MGGLDDLNEVEQPREFNDGFVGLKVAPVSADELPQFAEELRILNVEEYEMLKDFED